MRWLIYLAIIAIVFGGWTGSFPLDDAYITLHNARSLLEGGDPLYGQSPLVGATSSVHLLLLAGAGTILPLKLASFLLCLAAAIAYAAGLDRLIRKEGATGWTVPFLVSSGLLIGTVPLQLPNGLETGLAMACVAWLLALRDRRSFAVLAGVAPFIRPELAILSALLLIRYSWGRPVREAALTFAIAGALALPWLVWLRLETGAFVPSTASAKVAFFAELHIPAVAKLLEIIKGCGPYLPAFVGLGLGRDRWWRTGSVAAVLLVAFIMLPASLGWNFSRYLAPLMPVMLMGFARRRDALMAVIGAYALVTGIWSIITLQRAWAALRQDERQIRQSLQYVPAGSTILIHDAGLIAWVKPDAKLVDVVGLKTPDSARSHQRHTKHACQWDAALDEIARRSHAQFAVVLDVPFWRCIGENLARAGWQLEALPSGRYRLYRLSPPVVLPGAARRATD